MSKTPCVRRTLVALLALPLVASCAASTLTQTYRDAGYEPRPIHRVLVVGYTVREDALQASFEEALATSLRARGYRVATASSVFEPWQLDEETVIRWLRENEGDLVVQVGLVTRSTATLVPASVQVSTTQGAGGTPYAPPATGNSAASPYWLSIRRQPGQVNEDADVMAEIKVYSPRTGRLVWTGTSHTFHARGDVDTAESIAIELTRDLGKAGILIH